MKTIRIATGVKRVDLSQEDFSAIAKVLELLKEHRHVLINRLLADLNTYVSYQFKIRATQAQSDKIKNRLLDLRYAGVSAIRYDAIIHDILANDISYVKSEPFYFEINEIIVEELHPEQLQLVN